MSEPITATTLATELLAEFDRQAPKGVARIDRKTWIEMCDAIQVVVGQRDELVNALMAQASADKARIVQLEANLLDAQRRQTRRRA